MRLPDWRNDRPYAAWLYAERRGARALGAIAAHRRASQLGVTGPPAFGEFAQRTAHKLTGVYSREPVGWDTQVGFEPGIMLTRENDAPLRGRTSSGSVGGGLRSAHRRVARKHPHRRGGRIPGARRHEPVEPVVDQRWQSRAPVELYVLRGARGEAVAHNITLDGNTLGAERRVDRVPLVGEYSVGVGGRFRGLVAEWRAITRAASTHRAARRTRTARCSRATRSRRASDASVAARRMEESAVHPSSRWRPQPMIA